MRPAPYICEKCTSRLTKETQRAYLEHERRENVYRKGVSDAELDTLRLAGFKDSASIRKIAKHPRWLQEVAGGVVCDHFSDHLFINVFLTLAEEMLHARVAAIYRRALRRTRRATGVYEVIMTRAISLNKHPSALERLERIGVPTWPYELAALGDFIEAGQIAMGDYEDRYGDPQGRVEE